MNDILRTSPVTGDRSRIQHQSRPVTAIESFDLGNYRVAASHSRNLMLRQLSPARSSNSEKKKESCQEESKTYGVRKTSDHGIPASPRFSTASTLPDGGDTSTGIH